MSIANFWDQYKEHVTEPKFSCQSPERLLKRQVLIGKVFEFYSGGWQPGERRWTLVQKPILRFLPGPGSFLKGFRVVIQQRECCGLPHFLVTGRLDGASYKRYLSARELCGGPRSCFMMRRSTLFFLQRKASSIDTQKEVSKIISVT